jgi:spermidine synthase
LLTLVAIIGLGISEGWRRTVRWLWMPITLLVLSIIGAGRPIKASAGQIYETESAYNYIQVLERDGYRYLRLNDGQGIHSMYHEDEIAFYGPWMQFLAGPFFNQPPYEPRQVESMAIIGLAGGTTARQATAVFGPIPIDGFEIDPKIIEVGRKYFGMNQPNLNVVAQDGRWGLEHSQTKYTLIAMDAYRPPYIPWHLTTLEFFQTARDHLSEDGVIVMNVGRAPDDRRLVDGLVSTISSIFPSIYVIDVPGTFNSIIYATVQPTRIENLYNNFVYLNERGDVHPLLLESMQIAAAYQQPVPESDMVFTDDLAPIEWITNNMVLKFVLFGDMEVLQHE